jgi:hypothetical protein
MNRRSVLTELGPDTGALLIEDREGVLFDLGLDALQADLCVRFADEATVAQLREHVGGSVFEAGNPAMGIILASNPHRVFIIAADRVARTNIRVALRQLKALQHPSPVIPAWLEAFDRTEATEEDDDERQRGH